MRVKISEFKSIKKNYIDKKYIYFDNKQLHLSSSVSLSSLSPSSLSTSCDFLKTNSWNKTARMAPTNGSRVYSQTNENAYAPLSKSIVKLVPRAIAGLRTAPLRVTL